MKIQYIYESKNNSNFVDSTSAIIVMPDIFGITDYAMATMEEFAKVFHRPVFMLDYFYCLTNAPSNFSSDQTEQAFELMQKMRGEDFVTIFASAIKEIQAVNPRIEKFTVIGFCFAGRLAYLSGLEKSVDTIVSFYGAGAHTPGYYKEQTPVQALTNARSGDTTLKVLSFYGTQDESIPANDRAKTQQVLVEAKIDYIAKEYNAEHAYFQPGRPNYNEAAAKASWNDLITVIN